MLCTDESCISCFKKSFASSIKVKFWNYDRNIILPRQVFLNSNTNYWFTCEMGHQFDMPLVRISFQDSWCRYCVNKTEQKLQDHLLTDFPLLKRDCTPQWSSKKRYDFMIPELQIIIELDGPQHFIQISNWETPDTQFTNDLEKTMTALDNGYSVIRIIQEDVLNDTYDWYNELYTIIQSTNSTMVSCLCKNNEYELLLIHINAMGF